MHERTARTIGPHGWAAVLGPASLTFALFLASGAFGSELRETPIVKAVQRAAPSVVNIRGEKTVTGAAGQVGTAEAGRRVNGMGTGVVIDQRGYIVTNYHVVEGVREIQVTTAGGQRHLATLAARDTATDLALIKIDCGEDLPVISLGTSADLMPGETVVALGNAFGYEHTVTRGIVSALHRAVQVSDAQYYDDLIQTDASINPGNSGGPLLNVDGEMIGVNVAVRAGAQGIGFAIPVDRAMAVAADLLASCNENKTWHGVVPTAGAEQPGTGLLVAAVAPKSPADEVGLEPGDLITAVEDLDIHRALDFQRALLGRKAGEKLSLSVQRAGDPVSLQLTLAELPGGSKPLRRPAWDVLGFELQPVPAKDFRLAYQTRYRGGLTVTDVRPDSPAAAQGIRSGDVLVGMHIWETVSLENVTYILNRPDFNALSPVKFFILRGNETLYGYLAVAAKTETARRD